MVFFFQIATNKSHFAEYKHRLPVSLVNTVMATGDIQLDCIYVQPTLEDMKSSKVICIPPSPLLPDSDQVNY